MSTLSVSRRRKVQHASTDRTFLLILVGATVLIIVAIALVNWASNRPRAAVQAVDPAQLLPLAESVSPISGFHNMERMPNSNAPVHPVDAGTPQANVNLPLEHWDWGTIPAVPSVAQTFPIQNKGNEPLIITNVVTSCGCTTAELSSSVIPPGHRADLVVTFDPNFHATSGPVTRLVWLETNDPDKPVVELRMDANVVP